MSAEDRYRELVPLAALDGEEALEFRLHLETCAACRAELDEFRRVAAGIAAGVTPVPPPPELRQRVLAAAGMSPASPGRSRSRVAPWLGSLAAAAAALLAVSLVLTRQELARERERSRALAAQAEQARRELAGLRHALDEARSVHDLVVQPESRLTLLAGLPSAPGARGRVLWNASTRAAVLIASGLQPPPPGKAYEVWVIGESKQPVPAGVFRPAADGTALVKLPPVEETARPRTFAVTLEPAAGSPSPTGPMMLAGSVS